MPLCALASFNPAVTGTKMFRPVYIFLLRPRPQPWAFEAARCCIRRFQQRLSARHASSSSSTSSRSGRVWPWALGALLGFTANSWWSASWTTTSPRIAYANRSQMLKVSHSADVIYHHAHASQAAIEISVVLEGEDSVSFDQDVIDYHSHSEWSTSNTPERPVAVVYPRSTADVAAIARICYEYNAPMVPFGAKSSVEGNFSSPHSGICIDFAHMDQIIALRPDDMDVTLQPGVNWVDLNNQIAHTGLFLPLDPSPTAQIGGMVATNCSGTNAMRYGVRETPLIICRRT